MATYLDVPRERIRAVPLGINVRGHEPRAEDGGAGPFVVGYLARICPEKGLHVLADAFRLLAARAGKENVRLDVAGWLGPRDGAYLADVRRGLDADGLGGAVRFMGEVDRAGKLAFLTGLDVLSVPTTYREPKGLFVLESMASGVPVVQPAHGAFPELIGDTGGGVLFEPGSAAELAHALDDLRRDPDRRRELGRRGREAVLRDRTDDRMADDTLGVYHELVAPGLHAARTGSY
jgi:glycosyltransferase involved in cell wall biosynthesis